MAEINPHTTAHNELNERARHLLKTLIERHIRDGQPVGSRVLARDSGLDLSPATIRNIMADLEEMGYLRSPHTSAGRVPTVRGYRFFVDTLLQLEILTDEEVAKLRRQLDLQQTTDGLVKSVSSLLSGITQLVGVVMAPRRNYQTLRQIEFLPLPDQRVLAILVVNEKEVQNRIIRTERPYSAIELQQAANYLNTAFAGKNIAQLRENLLRELHQTRETMNQLMQTAIEMADKVFEAPAGEEDYIVAGQTNLMGIAELNDMEKLRHLFEAFSQKRDILHLFDQCLHGQGVQIFIGEEAGFDVLQTCSVVTAPYSVEGKALGVLGVIGPTRMPYERVIPIVDVTAKLLASALNSLH